MIDNHVRGMIQNFVHIAFLLINHLLVKILHTGLKSKFSCFGLGPVSKSFLWSTIALRTEICKPYFIFTLKCWVSLMKQINIF